MKKILFFLLTIAVALFAVEWEIEQVTGDPGRYNCGPSIILDGENPLILFEQFDDADYDFLKLAYKDNGSWVTEEVWAIEVALYSFAMDSEGNLYIAFTDRVGEDEENDLFLATDTSGGMVVHRLTEKAVNYRYPMIRLDENDNIHIVYAEGDVGEFQEDWIHYGYFEEGEFRSEVVTEHMMGTYNFDFVLSSDEIPHVFYGFYTDSDGKCLMHSFRSVSAEWCGEIILQLFGVGVPVPEDPSAAIDEDGKFHVSWDYNSSYIHYATDKSGIWQDEWVSDSFETYGYNYESSIALDPEGYPHIVWSFAPEEDDFYDIHYSRKLSGIWTEEPGTETPERYEESDDNHYFLIDDEGYGHMVFTGYELAGEDEIAEIYYAKSTEPLTGGAIAEQPIAANSFNLEILGSSVYFSLKETSPIRLDLYDAAGRGVQRLVSGHYPAGEHVVPINVSELAAGVYFVRIETGRQSASVKFMVTK